MPKHDILTVGEHNALYKALENMTKNDCSIDSLIATHILNRIDDSNNKYMNEEQNAATTLPLVKNILHNMTKTIANIREEMRAIQD